MKTSNRILLIFIICIFLLPVSLCMAYTTLIRQGKYKLVENIQQSNHKGTFQPASIVKVISTGRELICNISQSDSLEYAYDSRERFDSISVTNVGDTLLIRYVDMEPGNRNRRDFPEPLNMSLMLPGVSNMIIDHGRVNLLSMDTARHQKLVADVTGSGILNVGGSELQQPDTKQPGFQLDQLTFQTNGGNLELDPRIHIRELILQVQGVSNIRLPKGVRIDLITGAISDSTHIDANWETIKRFQPLTIK